ncbi:MAG: hypothetical protein R3C03_23610 [Pirellulaceae bacterium]
MIWQLAGIIGIDPSLLTLRELIWMADARRNEAWSHTANLMALVANVNRNPRRRSRPYSPIDFHPLVERKPPADTKVGVRILKDVFVRKP